MSGMHVLRNGRFRRWVAGGLAVSWLFTVLACAVDADSVPVEPAQVSQPASTSQAGSSHHRDGDSLDDPCCQAQASAVISFDVIKLPHAALLPELVSIALLFIFSRPSLLPVVAAAPDRYAVRRRSKFLIHSLQAQAPPR